ncbi:penicillin-binding protein 1C [Candidatus Poribacteria bacterium]|nr:penicillin-binding protein 1C [Candidatus Poribacteria bacterium]MYF54720.1 penicillin-binding protein 1C [Candidatus Poribacteria bacterium]MYI94523.1 penicillin-binding protein 1C [Candidatus Poribacteria bacterium]
MKLIKPILSLLKKLQNTRIVRFLLRRWYIVAIPITPFLLFLITNWCFPLPIEKLQPSPSTVILDRNGEWLRAFTSPDEMWRFPETSLDEISPLFQSAMLTYEDKYFYHHWGVNPVSLFNATIDNIRSGKVVRGGSTITMQLARLMEPKDRTIPNKIIEMFRALQLELTFTKTEILTHYFNMLPYGGNIVGSGAAARLYFNKPQSALSLGEAALLAAIPNSPEYLRPDRYPDSALKAREKVLYRMVDAGKISKQRLQEALKEPIPKTRYTLPFKAPHLSRLLVKEHPSLASISAKDYKIPTTVDMHYQDTAERILRESLRPLQMQGISTGAVVIMDTQSREVLAMVGSHDFFDKSAQGQVNGTLAVRSPGSTLKPFVYALAIDRGTITPKTILYDVPVDYVGYSPVNFDGKFTGYLTAEEALARSLNVPAVNLYAQMGQSQLYGFLKQAGITTFSDQEDYGLSLILGGCGVNLLELTNLYAGLANMGEFAPYQLVGNVDAENKTKKKKGTSFSTATRLLRPESSWIITEMLTTLVRPDYPEAFEQTGTMPKVAWKTGTSYGHRDAWSIGYSPELTIGVWVGNFNGTGSPLLSGSQAAAPILFNLFTTLSGEKTVHWYNRPPQLKTRLVCALSGLPVSKHCPTSTIDFYIPGVSSVGECHIHKSIQIDTVTGERLCSACRTGKEFRTETIAIFPAEVATWLSGNGFGISKLPKHNEDCTRLLAGTRPVILSPARDAVYHIRPNIPITHQKIRLAASVSGDTQDIFWFLNGDLIFSGQAVEPSFLTPIAGKHELTCIDGAGRSTSLSLTIEQ